MSIQAINQVLYHLPERVPDGQFRLLVYVADRADAAGEAIYPCVDWLVEKTGLKLRYVQLTLKRLRLKGWLQTYSVAGAVRWRLVCFPWRKSTAAAPVETPLGTVENESTPDPAIASCDPAIASCDPAITLLNDRTSSEQSELPFVDEGPPSFDPSFDPSVRPEEKSAAAASLVPPEHENESRPPPDDAARREAVDRLDVRAFLTQLKARIDSAIAPARRKRNRP